MMMMKIVIVLMVLAGLGILYFLWRKGTLTQITATGPALESRSGRGHF